jgi:LPS-assembly lipoprotein
MIRRAEGGAPTGRSCAIAVTVIALSLALPGCGFHLRGTASYRLPEALSTLRVEVAGSSAANDPLKAAMEHALRAQAGATVTRQADAPVLVLSGERTESETISVDSTSKVAEYRLRYQLSYELRDAQGRSLAPPDTVRALRDYRYDSLNVLAKEREEQELREGLRRDGVSQVVRRLARIQAAR